MRNQAVRLGDTIKVMNTIITGSDPNSTGSVDPDPDPESAKIVPQTREK